MTLNYVAASYYLLLTPILSMIVIGQKIHSRECQLFEL